MTPKRSTEDLIRALAGQPVPAPWSPVATLGATLGAGALPLALFLVLTGVRADLAGAMTQLAVQAKTVLPLGLGGLAGALAFASARPGQRFALWPLALPLALGMALVLLRLGIGPEATVMAEWVGSTALVCLLSITALSALPLATGLVFLRRAAPTRPALTGALLGLAVGGGVTAGYALHCTEDSPLFFMTWYSLAICLVTAMGAMWGGRFLRW